MDDQRVTSKFEWSLLETGVVKNGILFWWILKLDRPNSFPIQRNPRRLLSQEANGFRYIWYRHDWWLQRRRWHHWSNHVWFEDLGLEKFKSLQASAISWRSGRPSREIQEAGKPTKTIFGYWKPLLLFGQGIESENRRPKKDLAATWPLWSVLLSRDLVIVFGDAQNAEEVLV